jgi:alpha-D-ribose 1-methylphosphonate 5-triphosphate synthase subunit PhnH
VVRPLRLTLALGAVFASLALAGCGDQAAAPASPGATLAPATTAVLVSFDTDFDAGSWAQLQSQLEQLGGEDLLADAFGGDGLDVERDVKPALGPETYVVVLSLADETSPILLTQPADPAKLQELATKSDEPAVTREIDGWWAVADTNAALDRFEAARSRGTLADEDDYRDATNDLPEDALATVYLSGAAAAQAQGMTGAGADDKTLACIFGSDEGVPSSAFALTSEAGGLRLVGTSGGSPLTGDASKAAENALAEQAPAGALAFIELHELGDTLTRAIGCSAGKENAMALGLVESALGQSLEDTGKALFGGETAILVYPPKNPEQGEFKSFALATEVDDGAKTLELVDHLGQAAKTFEPELTVTSGTDSRVLHYEDTDITFAVEDDLLVVTADAELAARFRGDGERLADSAAYKDTLAAAGTPDETSGLAYVDVPGIATLFGGDGPQAKALDSLGGLVLWSEPDGDRVDVQGFLQIG